MKCKKCGKAKRKSCTMCNGMSHNKAARKSEGTRFAQMLRRKFGKNRPKK